jgi:hypothetical protein
MRRLRRGLKWWGLFALMPLLVALIVLDDNAPLSETWHMILLGAIVVGVCVLAMRWVERNPGLVECEGADSLVTYRPLPGTLDAMKERSVANQPQVSEPRKPISGYEPFAIPPVDHSQSDE